VPRSALLPWAVRVKLGLTEYIDCAHSLPGHPKCGRLHGHTYRVDIAIEGEVADGMILDFADLRDRVRRTLEPYDHASWNEVLDYPSVENICTLLAGRLREAVGFPLTVRVWEGHGKWAEL
jgi:6-pyruvoyltetrahydropterin/6-carboxytetrahydropterin synthase